MFRYSSDLSVRRQQQEADALQVVVFVLRFLFIYGALLLAQHDAYAVGLGALLLTLMTPRP